MVHTYQTKGTCSRTIQFELDGDVVTNVVFTGGCNGNLKAVSTLVNGMTVEEIEKKCKGILCGVKGTSCADQLATAVREAYEEEKNGGKVHA